MSFLPQAPVLLLALLLAGFLGCSRATLPPPEAAPPAPAPSERYEHPDQATLKAALQGRHLSPREALELSDRLLAEGSSSFQDQETMARLELLLLGAVKEEEEKTSRSGLLRNLGVIHYHQKKFKQARHELQTANEINPKDPRTHFYLARLHARQEQVYLRKGDKKRAKGQAKLADMEQGLARKLEPSNPLYRQDIREIIRQEPAK